MANEFDSLVLALLQRIDIKLDLLAGAFSDLGAAVSRLETETALTLSDLAALRQR